MYIVYTGTQVCIFRGDSPAFANTWRNEICTTWKLVMAYDGLVDYCSEQNYIEIQCIYIKAMHITRYILVGKAMMPCSPTLGGLHVKLQYTKCLSEGNIRLLYIRTGPYSKQILHCPCSRSVGATGRFSWPHSFATNVAQNRDTSC